MYFGIEAGLSGIVKTCKPDGLELREIVQALKAACDALTPGKNCQMSPSSSQ
jgi:hypothetical protein